MQPSHPTIQPTTAKPTANPTTVKPSSQPSEAPTSNTPAPTPKFDPSVDLFRLRVPHKIFNVSTSVFSEQKAQKALLLAILDVVGDLVLGGSDEKGAQFVEARDSSTGRRLLALAQRMLAGTTPSTTAVYDLYIQHADPESQVATIRTLLLGPGFLLALQTFGGEGGNALAFATRADEIDGSMTLTLLRSRDSGTFPAPAATGYDALPLSGKVLVPMVVILIGLLLLYMSYTYLLAVDKGEKPLWMQRLITCCPFLATDKDQKPLWLQRLITCCPCRGLFVTALYTASHRMCVALGCAQGRPDAAGNYKPATFNFNKDGEANTGDKAFAARLSFMEMGKGLGYV